MFTAAASRECSRDVFQNLSELSLHRRAQISLHFYLQIWQEATTARWQLLGTASGRSDVTGRAWLKAWLGPLPVSNGSISQSNWKRKLSDSKLQKLLMFFCIQSKVSWSTVSMAYFRRNMGHPSTEAVGSEFFSLAGYVFIRTAARNRLREIARQQLQKRLVHIQQAAIGHRPFLTRKQDQVPV